ncbi:MAG: hypothetical protein Q8Q06_03855 [bacterium]|nr:hypothetical protein [bacterium]
MEYTTGMFLVSCIGLIKKELRDKIEAYRKDKVLDKAVRDFVEKSKELGLPEWLNNNHKFSYDPLYGTLDGLGGALAVGYAAGLIGDKFSAFGIGMEFIVSEAVYLKLIKRHGFKEEDIKKWINFLEERLEKYDVEHRQFKKEQRQLIH